MASHRIRETGLSDSGPSNHHVPYAVFHGINAPASFLYVRQFCNFLHCSIRIFVSNANSKIICYRVSFLLLFKFEALFASRVMPDMGHLIVCFLRNQEGSAFDFGELEEAIVLQGVKIRNDEAKARMFLTLSIISPFVTYERHNQLLKAEKGGGLNMSAEGTVGGCHFQYCNDSETRDSSGVRLQT